MVRWKKPDPVSSSTLRSFITANDDTLHSSISAQQSLSADAHSSVHFLWEGPPADARRAESLPIQRDGRLNLGASKSLASDMESAVVVCDGERLAELTIAKAELAFEVSAPNVVGA